MGRPVQRRHQRVHSAATTAGATDEASERAVLSAGRAAYTVEGDGVGGGGLLSVPQQPLHIVGVARGAHLVAGRTAAEGRKGW